MLPNGMSWEASCGNSFHEAQGSNSEEMERPHAPLEPGKYRDSGLHRRRRAGFP